MRLSIGFLMVCVGLPAYAGVLVGNVGDDHQFALYMKSAGYAGYQNYVNAGDPIDYSQELYSVQGRIGNNATNGNNEIGLHWNLAPLSTAPTDSAAITGTGSTQRVWGSAGTLANVTAGNLINALVDFTVARVGTTVTFTFGPTATPFYQASYTDPTVDDTSLIAFRARASASATTTASRVKLENIVLNGVSMGNFGILDTTNNAIPAVSNYVITGVTGDYILTGRTTLDWSGTALTGSGLAFQIKHFAPSVPEPSTYLMVVAGLAGVAWGRRKAA
jgi:hypothetical protein